MICRAPQPPEVVDGNANRPGCDPATLLQYVISSKNSLMELWTDLLLLESNLGDQAVLSRIVRRLEALAFNSAAKGFADVEGVSLGLRDRLVQSDAGRYNGDARAVNLLWEGWELLSLLICESERQVLNYNVDVNIDPNHS